MSQMTEIRVKNLEKKVADLEGFVTQILAAFPDRYTVVHKGFQNYYTVNRFLVPENRSPLDKEAAHALCDRLNEEREAA